MIYLVFFIVCLFASILGTVCGIGGGMIIKPVLDSIGVMDVATISFLSSCTVLSMATYSVIRGEIGGEADEDNKVGLPLAVGAALGGLIGKWLFSFISSLSPDKNKIGAVQAICLLIVTIGTLICTLNKNKIKTHKVTNMAACSVIGLFLGLQASFLGIGGGPINLVLLFFFFSMPTKTAAKNSLYIIFFSQMTNLLSALIKGDVPHFPIGVLVLMVIGGIVGGICGITINKKIEEKSVDKMFIGLMVGMIIIITYNIKNFLS